MSDFILKRREEVGKRAAARIRRAGAVPGVIYGDKTAPRYFSLAENLADKILRATAGSGLLKVKLEGEAQTVPAILQAVARDPVSGRPEHLDLYQVRMDKVLHTEVPLHFVGTAPAVKDLGGILVKQSDHLPIECLPADLVTGLEVPIGELRTFADFIKVKDLKLPPGIKVRLDGETIIASAAKPRSEAELAELSSAVKADVSAVAVVSEKKKEAEAAETAAAEKAE